MVWVLFKHDGFGDSFCIKYVLGRYVCYRVGCGALFVCLHFGDQFCVRIVDVGVFFCIGPRLQIYAFVLCSRVVAFCLFTLFGWHFVCYVARRSSGFILLFLFVLFVYY